MKIKIACFLLLLPVFLGCTKDDICIPETPKTPLLIIRFFDSINTSIEKPVPGFAVVFEQDGEIFSLYEPTETDSVAIPLRTDSDVTNYLFFKNFNAQTPDIDELEFTYTRSNEFISRACAFRTNFGNVTINVNPAGSTGWIQNITRLTDTLHINNQNAAHIHIFH